MRNAQLGCLGVLLVLGMLGFVAEYLSQHDEPSESEGGGPVASLGVVGFILLVVIFAVIEIVRTITRRMK